MLVEQYKQKQHKVWIQRFWEGCCVTSPINKIVNLDKKHSVHLAELYMGFQEHNPTALLVLWLLFIS